MKPSDFFVGMTLDINEECSGVVTEISDDSIFIESSVFRGWARKEEIAGAATEWATQEQLH